MKNLDLDKLAQEYIKTCIRPFKRVAERAFKDGYEAAQKHVRQRLEMENTEYDYGHNIKNNSEEE